MLETRTATAPVRYPWIAPGDLNAFFALMLDNMINLVVLSGILVGAFGFPAEVIATRMIPGTALGVLVGDGIYTWMARRMARRTGRDDVTAMPLGLDTPSTIGVTLAVLGPAFVAARGDLLQAGVGAAEATMRAAEAAWGIGMAVMLVMGAVKVLFAFAGEWVRANVPTAGLLGSIGGIGLALLCFFPLLTMFEAPVVGLVVLGLVLYTLVAKVDLPGRVPGAAVAVVVGTALHYGLGALGLGGPGAEPMGAGLDLQVNLPWPTAAGFTALGDALPYLPIAVPFGLLTIVGGINVTESARFAGDAYRTRDILLTEAGATLVAGLCGGVAQTTPYIGHPAYKAMGARAGYTLLTGIFVGLGGMLGYVSTIVHALPEAAVVPLLLFVGLEITVQAFHASPRHHAPAVALAFLPILGDLVLIRQDALLGNLRGALTGAAVELGEAAGRVHEIVDQVAAQVDAGIVIALGHGFIITAMMWGSMAACLIERQIRRASAFAALTGLMTLFGIVHSVAPAGDLYWPWAAPDPSAGHMAAGYFALAAVWVGLSFTREARVTGSAPPPAAS